MGKHNNGLGWGYHAIRKVRQFNNEFCLNLDAPVVNIAENSSGSYCFKNVEKWDDVGNYRYFNLSERKMELCKELLIPLKEVYWISVYGYLYKFVPFSGKVKLISYYEDIRSNRLVEWPEAIYYLKAWEIYES